ncbi:MAG: hypothetical protein JOZ17_14860 [Acetobacteraceae bacterium]|nr:hypothetical protein [Acetobacteraceae bacterium]
MVSRLWAKAGSALRRLCLLPPATSLLAGMMLLPEDPRGVPRNPDRLFREELGLLGPSLPESLRLPNPFSAALPSDTELSKILAQILHKLDRRGGLPDGNASTESLSLFFFPDASSTAYSTDFGWPDPGSDPSISFAFKPDGTGQLQTYLTGMSASAESGNGPGLGGTSGGTGISTPVVSPNTSGSAQPACSDNALTNQMQAGGNFWNAQAVSASPVPLVPNQFSRLITSDSLEDPTKGPSGGRTNVPAEGPAGAWCRPPPVPVSQADPFQNPSLVVPALLLAFGSLVFWLSRGFRTPE